MGMGPGSKSSARAGNWVIFLTCFISFEPPVSPVPGTIGSVSSTPRGCGLRAPLLSGRETQPEPLPHYTVLTCQVKPVEHADCSKKTLPAPRSFVTRAEPFRAATSAHPSYTPIPRNGSRRFAASVSQPSPHPRLKRLNAAAIGNYNPVFSRAERCIITVELIGAVECAGPPRDPGVAGGEFTRLATRYSGLV
jgi:hypothetical protein